MSIASPERRHDLDALRVFGCYLLFLFHAGMVFNPASFFHVRNDESSLVFLVLLPVLTPLARRRLLAARPSRAWVYLPILPLALVQLTLRERFPGPYNLYNDWANVAFYVTFLAAGFALAVAPGLEARLHEERRRLLGLGIAATGVLLAAVLGAFASTPVVLAAAIVPLPLGVAPKFALLLAGSVAATLALDHFGARPFRPTRWLLGMKPRPRAPRPAPRAPQAAAAGRARAWRRAVPLALLAPALLPATAGAAGPTGLWWAERGFAQVEVRRCEGGTLCGEVVWLRHPLDERGCTLRDEENPEPALRGRPVVGLEILRGLEASPDDPGAWRGGEIYDPGSGRTYSATLEMDGPDRLRVRGYLGIRLLGRTTTWVRVGLEARCRESA